MVKDLRLKGTELMIYAIIYGFSQDDQHFTGSLQYLQDWTNCSRQAVIDNLKSLIRKGLLQKFVYQNNGVTFCEYHAKNLTGSQDSVPPRQESVPGGWSKNLTGGSQKSVPNIITDNINYNNIAHNNSDADVRNHLSDTQQRLNRAHQMAKELFPDLDL